MKKILFITIVLVVLSACKSKQNTTNTLEDMQSSKHIGAPDMHTSQTSLDYHGAYYGLLPCADCMGIQLKLTIDSDSSYTTESIYLGKNKKVIKESGQYKWGESGNEIIGNISSKKKIHYKVEENRLLQLGQEGQINGDLANRYMLYKNPEPIWNRLWFATSINGEKIEQEGVLPNLTFLPNGKVYGSGGCNRLNANYKLGDKPKIKVSTIALTKRGCGNLKHFDYELSEALRMATTYKVINDKLHLIDSEANIIAKFKAETID